MRALDTYRGARRNVARDIGGIQLFQPRVGPYRRRPSAWDGKVEPRSLHYRHIVRTLRFGGREYQLHATKGWRSYAA